MVRVLRGVSAVVGQVAAIERAGGVKSTPGGSPDRGIKPPTGDVPPARVFSER
jgi:hypothetical protein